MKRTVTVLALLLLSFALFAGGEKESGEAMTEAATAPSASGTYQEAPMLAELVSQGLLPPVDQRLPAEPWVVEPLESMGKYGGKLASVVADPTGNLPAVDWALGRPVAGRSYDMRDIIPVAIKGWELSPDYKELTVFMREGQKWSDGQPFTTDDVMFWYQGVFLNKELTPTVDKKWAPGGEPMKIVADGEYVFRIQFAIPHPAIIDFLPSLTCWAPAHYLSKWHPEYDEKAGDLAKSENYDSWVQAYQYHAETSTLQSDFDLPSLSPFVLDREDVQGSRFYVRNPYYYAVDPQGRQLPYTDSIERIVVENREVLNARILAGEGTHHSWFLSLANYPLYKQNETKAGYTVSLYTDLRASEFGFAFNYNHNDPVLSDLFNDVRWRQAMSHALNRAEINELRFAGLGTTRQPIMDPSCSFYIDGIDQKYTEFDIATANRLLDEIGLKWDSEKKWRLRPDDDKLSLTMEVDAGRADLTEVCNLIKGYWAKVGVDLSVKGIDQQFLMQRMRANEHDIGVWAIGGSSETYSRQNEPIRYRPPWHWSSTPLSGPLWRQWLDTGGTDGMEPPEIIKELWDTTEEWRRQPFGTEKYKELGRKILQINADNAWLLGTVGLVPRVGIVKDTVRNAPQKGNILSVEFNMWTYYLIDQWWIDE